MVRKLIVAAVVVAILGGAIGAYMWFKPRHKVEDANAIPVTSIELVKQFSANENAANEKYISKDHSKAVEVTGVVTDVEKNQDGGTMIVLAGGDDLSGVQCSMRENGIVIESGKQVTIVGYCSGFGITGVTLTDCVIK